MMKLMVGGAGFAALAAAAPAAAQYYPYQPGYSGYGYNYNYNVTQAAAQRCSAAVQARLNNRSRTGILGGIFGVNTRMSGRVLSVTQVRPRRSTVLVRGLATSGRFAGYGPYGIGAYGSLGYQYQPDLRFSCSVDYRGYIRDVDIMRR